METVPFSRSKSDGVRASSSPFSDAAPVEHLECVVGGRLVHHHLGKFQVLLLCPEQHFLILFPAHIANLAGRIGFQVVMLYSMVEDGAKLGIE